MLARNNPYRSDSSVAAFGYSATTRAARRMEVRTRSERAGVRAHTDGSPMFR